MTWSGFWGGTGTVAGALWVYMNRDVPYTAAVGAIIEARFEAIAAVVRKIEGAFDLDTAVGNALDVWGARLGLMRAGYDDSTYRRALKVWRSLLLSGAGTRANLISVYEDWTGYTVREATNFGRTIHIAGEVDPADEARLLSFLTMAKPAGRQLELHHVVDGDLLCDYEDDPIAGAGTLDYEASPVTGAAELPGQIT